MNGNNFQWELSNKTVKEKRLDRDTKFTPVSEFRAAPISNQFILQQLQESCVIKLLELSINAVSSEKNQNAVLTL